MVACLLCYLAILFSIVHGWTFTSLFRLPRTVSFEPNIDPTVVDEYFMELAFREAHKAYKAKEVPIGAVVVWDNGNGRYQIMSQAHNQVENCHDASAHAELVALRRAARRKRNWRLTNATLYSTLEPCVMCCASAQAFRIDRIVYGGDDLRLGAIQSHMRLLETKHPYHTISNVVGGVHANQSQSLLRDFFRERRRDTKKKFVPTNRQTRRFRFELFWQSRKNCRKFSERL